MKRTRVGAWWDEFRYGAGWQIVLAVGLALSLAGALLATFIVHPPSHVITEAERGDRQKQQDAECIARGGHVVQMIMPMRGVGDRACYGGSRP